MPTEILQKYSMKILTNIDIEDTPQKDFKDYTYITGSVRDVYCYCDGIIVQTYL